MHPEWFRLMPPDATIPFEDASFDVVTAFMVVEHVADPSAFLHEVTRVLRPGGHFVAHTISALHYISWLRRVFDVLPHRWTQRLVRRLYGREEYDTFPTWYRLNTPRRIARYGKSLGLTQTSVRRYAWPGYFTFSPSLCRCAILADWMLERVGAGLGRIYFTATYRKSSDMAIAKAA
jgi:SAM-dependent methyltransferase